VGNRTKSKIFMNGVFKDGEPERRKRIKKVGETTADNIL
jgi:hypothetical protein